MELKLVELYSLNFLHKDPYTAFTKLMLKELYKDDLDHDVDEIGNFFNIKNYVHNVMLMINIININILSKINPNAVAVKFNRFTDTTNQILAEFTVNYYEV